MREGSRQVLPPDGDAPHPEVRLAEVDLALAGEPAELQEALGVAPVALLGHLLAPEPHVAPRGGVGALVAALLPQPGARLRRGMALLAPVAEVAVEPRIYVRDMWGEQLAPRSAPPRALRGQVLHPQVLPDGGLRHPGLPRDRGDGLAPPTPSSYILYLVHADHSYSDLPYGAVCRQATYDWPPRGVVGMPMLISAIFSCRKPKLLVLKSPTRRLSKTRDMPCRHGVAPARWRAASRMQARSPVARSGSRSPPARSGMPQPGRAAQRPPASPVVPLGARIPRGRPRTRRGTAAGSRPSTRPSLRSRFPRTCTSPRLAVPGRRRACRRGSRVAADPEACTMDGCPWGPSRRSWRLALARTVVGGRRSRVTRSLCRRGRTGWDGRGARSAAGGASATTTSRPGGGEPWTWRGPSASWSTGPPG